MKAIMNRLRRLEIATAPVEQERAATEAILEARQRRLGQITSPFRSRLQTMPAVAQSPITSPVLAN
jgi:hypothetical protein